jgi:hypothetical protein
MQQPLISKWAITPLDWFKMHPKSVPSSLLGSRSTKRVKDEKKQVLQTYSKQIVGANEISRGYTRSP